MYNIGALELGAQDIGAEDEIGAAVRKAISRRMPQGRVVGAVQPRNPYGNPVTVQQDRPRRYAYQMFGLGSSALGAAGTTSLNQVFQEAFRPERVVLADSVAGNSTITGIFIGVKPQLANIGSLPASMLAAGTFETRVEFDTGNPGQNFLVNITMAAAGTISGGAFGSVVK